MDTPNPYQFPNQGQQDSNIPPPPPSPEGQVGVRGMQSDLESIKQSGGEAPQSQIVNAPELAKFDQSSFGQPAQSQPQPSFTPPPPSQPPADQPEMSAPSSPEPEVPKKSLGLKTILFIIIGLIVAGGLGYGAYYLVTSLNSSPQIATPPATSSSQQGLPVTAPAVTSSATTATSTVPVAKPLVHTSLILSPTKSETLQLAGLSLTSFESALATSSAEKLAAGSVKDIAFADASGTAVSSDKIFTAYFSGRAVSLTPLFEKDFTSWLYYGTTGGVKLGMVFKLNVSVPLAQASSTVRAAFESTVPSLAAFFISNPAVPASTGFSDGQVSEVPVRFLTFSSKNADIFEYGWVARGSDTYLAIATSYNQMLDITKRLLSLPVSAAPATSTSTTSTTP